MKKVSGNAMNEMKMYLITDRFIIYFWN